MRRTTDNTSTKGSHEINECYRARFVKCRTHSPSAIVRSEFERCQDWPLGMLDHTRKDLAKMQRSRSGTGGAVRHVKTYFISKSRRMADLISGYRELRVSNLIALVPTPRIFSASLWEVKQPALASSSHRHPPSYRFESHPDSNAHRDIDKTTETKYSTHRDRLVLSLVVIVV